MLVSEVMRKDFETVQQTEQIQEAANKMKAKKVPVLLVVEKEHIRGILTEKEVAKAMSAASERPEASLAAASGSDDANRCCYFNDVQVELLLSR